ARRPWRADRGGRIRRGPGGGPLRDRGSRALLLPGERGAHPRTALRPGDPPARKRRGAPAPSRPLPRLPGGTRMIYLASRSPRRRELLTQVGVRFEPLLLREGARRDTDTDESAQPG